MAIRVLITGGTIDGIDYIDEKRKKTIIPEMLILGRISEEYSTEVICLKDSRFLNKEDLDLLLQRCLSCHESKIIVTHGTITMANSAKFLGKARMDKTIVLVGAEIFGDRDGSDALFNLGMAFSAVQLLPPGVYVTMNGKIFSWESVKKDAAGYFHEQ
jgi:L-asparaginase